VKLVPHDHRSTGTTKIVTVLSGHGRDMLPQEIRLQAAPWS